MVKLLVAGETPRLPILPEKEVGTVRLCANSQHDVASLILTKVLDPDEPPVDSSVGLNALANVASFPAAMANVRN
jgi:hypothetical protein